MSFLDPVTRNKYLFQAYNNRGIIYAKIKKYDKASEDFKNAIRINVSSDVKINAIINLCWVYALRGWKIHALELLDSYRPFGRFGKSILEMDRDQDIELDSRSLHVIGYVDYVNKKIESSKPYFERSIDKNNSKFSHYQLGRIFVDEEKFSSAIDTFDKAISIDENFAECYNAKAYVYGKQQDFDKATDQLRKAIKIRPNLTLFYENLIKSVTGQRKQTQTFVDYWNSSTGKQLSLIGLIVFAGIILTYGMGIFNQLSTVDVKGNESSIYSNVFENITTLSPTIPKSIKNTTLKNETTNTKTESPNKLDKSVIDIPTSYLIIIGIIIFIIIFPQLKSAKLGQIEFELLVSDSIFINNTLGFTEDDFYTSDEFENKMDLSAIYKMLIKT